MKITDKKNIEDILPLTPMQQGMLFHYLKDRDSDYYFEQLCLTISGEIDLTRFKQAWVLVLETNEVLRTRFIWESVTKPVQVVLKNSPLQFTFHDFSNGNRSENDKKNLVQGIKDNDRKNKFNLNSVPFRITLCKLGQAQYEMLISNHHILYDGWSNGIILKEFFSFYHQLAQKKSPLKPHKHKYKEYINRIQGRDVQKQREYWSRYLNGFDTKPELSIKKVKGKDIKPSASGNSHYNVKFSKRVREKLEVFIKSHQVTLAGLLYSAWGILLQRYNNSEDVVFGTTVSGRSPGVKGIEDMVGLFINTVPLRVRTNSSGHEKIKDFLSRVNQELRERETYESASLVEIKEYGEVSFAGELFDTIFVIENYPLDKVSLERNSPRSLSVDAYSLFETTHYDLTVGITTIEDIEVEFTYNEDLFDETIITGLSSHFVKIVEDMVDNPGKELAVLEILSEAEKDKILFEFNNTTADYPGDKTIHQLFAEQVKRIPDHIAVIGQPSRSGGTRGLAPLSDLVSITYRELNNQSTGLAYILTGKGVSADIIVGIAVERSIEMMVGILGILKAGGAYLPIDPDYPEERKKYMLKDSSASILLATEDTGNTGDAPSYPSTLLLLRQVSLAGCLRRLSEGQGEAPLGTPTKKDRQLRLDKALAYIIYTSGTTGKPKGVMIGHAALMNRLSWVRDKYRLNEKDVILQATSFVFDVSVCEMFRWIPAGGRLCLLPPGGEKDPGQIIRTIARNGVTTVDFIPAMLTLVLDYAHRQNLEKELAGLRWVWTGVEVVDVELVKRFNETLHHRNQTRLINAYGPTESTVDITYFDCTPSENNDVVPIGRPMANVRVFILASNGAVQPLGVYGQLCIAGKGLARGYLNNPELTFEKFCLRRPGGFFRENRPLDPHKSFLLRDPDKYHMQSCNHAAMPLATLHSHPLTIYHTGDLARWLADGNIQFLGRIDHQVKIRGHRVELGEIESRLLNYPGIKEAVVSVQEEERDDKYLCAYVVSAVENVIPGLREFLAKELPDYMIPDYFMPIEKIPLTSSGKLDRKALPKPGLKIGESYTAPGDTIEKKLVEIWSEVLGRDELHAAQLQTSIGIDDNFFRLGGHSLKATILVAKIHKVFDVIVPVAEIFKTPGIRELAKYIKGKSKEFHISIEPAEDKEYYELSPAQKRLYILQQLVADNTGYNMPDVIPLDESVEKKKLESVFKKLIERHDSLRTSFITVNEKPVQRIHREVDFSIGWNEIDEEAGVVSIIPGFTKPFNLGAAPLLRVNLVSVGSSRRVLFVDMHHIIMDGTSQSILEKEFRALLEGEVLRPPRLRLRYKDYSEWYNHALRQKVINRQKSYWLKEFSGELPVLELPSDYPRPALQGVEGNVVNFSFNIRETGILKAIAKENEATLYMALLAIFSILLAKLSGQEDIIIGTPIAARRHADLANVIGMLVNTLAMRNYPAADKPFRAFLKEVGQRSLDAYENQEYPFEVLVDKIAVNRDAGRNPVFDVMLNLLNQEDYRGEIPAEGEQPVYHHIKRTSRFDMAFSAVDMDDKIYFTLEYSTRLYTPATIERFIRSLEHIIISLPGNIDKNLSEIDYIPVEEKERILDLSPGVSEIVDKIDLNIPGVFEEKVRECPDKTALVFAGSHLSYNELNRRANRLARFLRKRGVAADIVVGLMIDRSLEMVIAILAILKAGGAYMPVDPEYPLQRILTMLNDSRVSLLLTRGKLLDRFSITALKDMTTGESDQGLIITPPRAQIKDFDGIPIPNRTLIDYKKYHRYIGEAPVKHSITLQATRGCPFNCSFCHKIWPKTHVARSAENIFKEISYAYDGGIRRFVFIDDIFNLDQKNAARFLETVIKSKLDIQLFFPNGFRADILSKGFIDLMVAAGTINLDVALESASPRIQKLIGKNLHLDKFKENVQYIAEKYPHVILEIEMMHGFPTETEAEALLTLDFLKEIKWVHFPNLHILKIFPNTGMYRLAIENGISEKLIRRSTQLAFHELPGTLPFPGSFTRQFQARFMGEYFLSRERLLHVLPQQMNVLSEDELVQKYDSYLSSEIKSFDDILRYVGLSRRELGDGQLKPDHYEAPQFTERIRRHFPRHVPAGDAFRVLLLDLSQLFTGAHEQQLHHQVEEPLGLMYLATYLEDRFKERIHGKICKSRIDFDSYRELKRIILEFKPRLIGIRTLSYFKEFFHRTVMMIRQWEAAVPIVTGGPYATSDFQSILQDKNVDLIVLGEGELTLGELVEKMIANQGELPGEDVLAGIHGIAFAKDKVRRSSREIVAIEEISPGSSRCDHYNLHNLRHGDGSSGLLYVIYTSGSTGTPKGVLLEHRHLLNLIRHQYAYTSIDFRRVLQFTTLGFDVSAQEIFSTLLAGGSLVLINKETQGDIPRLLDVLRQEQVETLFLPASFLKYIMNEEEFIKHIPVCIKHIVTAGEQAVINERFRKYLIENSVYFHNHYGPAETHVVTVSTLQPGVEIPGLPHIGRPVMNTRIYILDRGMNLVPIGVPGQLVIGGNQVGRGYMNNPGLTAEKFEHDLWDYRDYHDEEEPFGRIINAFGEREAHELHELTRINQKLLRGEPDQLVSGSVGQWVSSMTGSRGNESLIMAPRQQPETNENQHKRFAQHIGPPRRGALGRRRQNLYKTGDLARWQPDGSIEFLGRIDHQVKIRGFRVELGEIEKRLFNHPGIKEAVVLVLEEERGDKYICAYIVPNRELEISGLREYLSLELPGYMIPSYFVMIEKIPLTPNRKIDRKALPKPGLEVGESYIAPRDEIEKKLVELWAEILGGDALPASRLQPALGIDDNFFELGGHSLKATILAARIHRELNVNVPLARIFKTPNIRGLAAYIEEAAGSKPIPVQPVEKKEYYPLSSTQRRLYILQQMDEQGIGYSMPSVWQLQGGLDVERFEGVFQELIQRHESLRTFFHMVNAEPVQRIDEEVEVKVQVEEKGVPPGQVLDAFGVGDTEGTRGFAPLSFIRSFDLSCAPLLRVGLIKMNEQTHILMVDMHHIISDGVSIEIFVKEFTELYGGKRLSPLRRQYRDYSQWHHLQVESKFIQEQQTYWLKQFAGEVPVLRLPTDYPRPRVQRFAGRSRHFEMNKEETAALKSLARDREVTLFMLLLSVYTVFLCKLSGQQDIVVGTVVAGRRHADLQGIIGMFVNTLALRNFPVMDKTFDRYLEEIKENTIKTFENQDYPYEDLVEKVDLERDTGRNPLFDAVFTLQNFEALKIEIPGLQVQPIDYETHISKFDLTLTTVETGKNLLFTLEYCTGLFKQDTVERFIGYFIKTVSTVIGSPGMRIADIEIIGDKEKSRILHEFNDTAADYPKDKTIHRLFEEQVERTPDRIALVGSPVIKYRTYMTHMTYISYRQLNEKSQRLACYLIEKGARPDTIVGIMMERCVDMIIGIFGILKAGGAYMPIDPDYPPERIDYMLKDSQSVFLLTASTIAEAMNRSYKTHMSYISPASLAYVIYTSGSTGKPKGAMIEHHSVINRLNWMQEAYPIGPGDVILQKTPVVFDVSVWELFWWSFYGAGLSLLGPGEEKDPGAIVAALGRYRVTTMHFVPSMLNAFLVYFESLPEMEEELKQLKSLKQVFSSGEALPVSQVERYNQLFKTGKPPKLINLYGPTEATVDVSYFQCPEGVQLETVPIGKPIDNIRLYVLAGGLQLQPIGIGGELVIAGVGLARGYLNNPGLTREKFEHDLWDYRDYHDEEEPFGRIINAFGEREAHELHELTRINQKLLRGEPDQLVSGSVGQWVSSMTGSRGNESLIMAPRQQPETNENQHKRFAQHIGPPRRGAPGRRRQNIYKTGDLARWLEDGNIEFLGRIDNQVKIRGFRVELEEIETLLTSSGILPVKEAAAVARPDPTGDNRVIAYIVPDKKRVYTVFRLLELGGREYPDSPARYQWPNRMPVYYLNRMETDFMYKEIFADRTYIKHGISLEEGACVFDVGANIGVFSLFVHRYCKKARVYSFEPLPPVYRVLTLNTSLYDGDFRTFNYGIGAGAGEAVFTYYPHVTILSGSSPDREQTAGIVKAFLSKQETDFSLDGEKDAPAMEEVYDELLAERLTTAVYTCKIKSLSQVIEENEVGVIDLLKIDVEKAEMEVLAGIKEEHWPLIRQLVIEVHEAAGKDNVLLQAITRLLENKGYRIAVEQEQLLENTRLYNLYAVRRPGEKIEEPKEPVQEPVPEPMQEPLPELFQYSVEDLVQRARDYLISKLPAYMVPAHILALARLPLTASGKIDRNALPEPGIIKGKGFTPPQNEIEEKLVEIWSEVLGLAKEKISIHDNFFHLGGHSLKAALLAARIHKKLNVNIPLLEIFKTPILKDLAQYIKKKAASRKYISIEPAEDRDYYVLSSAQKRLYVIQQMDPGSTVYNIPAVTTLLGEPDRIKFAGAFEKLIQRHESLRTSFHMLQEKPVQRIHDQVNFEIEYDRSDERSSRLEGTRGLAPLPDAPLPDAPLPAESAARSPQLAAKLISSFIRPFDLSRAPLLRVGLIKQAAQTHILMIDMNHIISDGISMGILEKEFMALIAGKDPGPLRTRYRDWTQWQNHEKNSTRVKNQELYWLREFAGKIPVLNLPCDYTRPAVQDFTGKRVTFALSSRRTGNLNSLARQEEVTLYMLLLSAYYVLLYQLTGQEDIIIGAPTAGRFQAELQNIIGMFLNTLALRNFPRGGQPFKLFLKEVKTKVLNAFDNQEYQFDDLVERLEVKRAGNRNPLFDVMFLLQNQGTPEIQIPGLELRTGELELEHTTTKFDFSLYAEEAGNELLFSVNYRERLFTPATITLIIDYFKAILASVIKNPDQALSDINVIPAGRRTAILSQLNTDLESEAMELTAGGFFQASLNTSLQRFKDRLAIESEDRSLSYEELDRRADRLCRWLLREGIARGTFMGILIEERIDFISTMIGILRAGGVMVPLYPQLPIQRIEDMVQEIEPGYIFADTFNIKRFEGAAHAAQTRLVFINPGDIFSREESLKKEPLPAVSYSGADPCYIYFTSGSTGKPKPIVGKNRSLLHFISWEIKTFAITNDFRVSQFTIPTFDPFLRDVFAPLLAGAKICIPAGKETLIDSARLAHWVASRQINLIHCVPALFRLLSSSRPNPANFKSLKFILLAGEKINPTDLVDWYKVFGDRVQLVNMYGPTETTLAKVCYLIKSQDIYRERIPIGNPIKGSRVIILDKNQRLCAPLQVGEICIRTPFRSFGYYNDPKLNQEKFITNPFSDNPGDILYRSGDLGRVLADGNVDILGRIDRQVKIRGYRIEMEEVELALVKEPFVKEAVVTIKGNSRDREYLCAYITITADRGKNSDFDPISFIGNLKQALSARLPDYMVPANIFIIKSIPGKIGGKVDYERLPDLVEQGKPDYIPPATGIERKLVKIWSEILKIEQIGIRDHFFELGGNSLNVVSLASKIHKEFQVKISLEEIFRSPTLEKQSQLIKGAGKDKFLSIEAAEKKEYYKSSAAQQRIYFLQQTDLKSTAYNITHMTLLEGNLDRNRWEETFNKLLQRHESLRTSFEMRQGELIQAIHEEVDFRIQYHDAAPVEVKVNEERFEGTRGLAPLPGDPGGEPCVHPVFPDRLPGQPHKSQELRAKSFIYSFIRPFDLSRAPLVRIGLVKMGENHSLPNQGNAYMLIMDIHHITADLTSMSIIMKDFPALYEGNELMPLSIQYKDYAGWENSKEQRDVIKRQEDYWLKEFAGDRPTLNLPLDYPRTGEQVYRGKHLEFMIGKEETGRLQALVSKEDVTLYIILSAIFNILLAKLSGQEDIVIGTPAAGRRHEDLRNVTGMFVKTLPLRNYPGKEKTFAKFLAEVKDRAVQAFENQDYPFQDLVEQLKISREAGRNPLFDVLFQLDNIDIPEVRLSQLRVIPYKYEIGISKFDLGLRAVESKESISFTFEYADRLFKKETIERMVGYFKKLLAEVIRDINIKLSEIDILTGKEKKQVLFDFNDTAIEYPREKTIHGLFEEQVEKTPDNTAVAGPLPVKNRTYRTYMTYMTYITYKELNEEADRLAHILIGRGVVPGTIVGILAEPSCRVIVVILAILKAGGAYLPISPGLPRARREFMLLDSGTKFLIIQRHISETDKALPDLLPSGDIMYLEDEETSLAVKEETTAAETVLPNPRVHVTPGNPGYVIYTSGSSGRPKGVVVEHRGIVNYICWAAGRYVKEEKVTFPLFTSFAFDLTVTSIFTPLVTGNTMVIYREEKDDKEFLIKKVIEENRVNIIKLTPSHLKLILEIMAGNPTFYQAGQKSPIKRFIVGGESLPARLAGEIYEKFNRDIEIYNEYGPTETVVGSMIHQYDPAADRQGSVPIGAPIANTCIYLLDRGKKPVPQGVAGELFISGAGVGRGYLNRPELTAEKFDHDLWDYRDYRDEKKKINKKFLEVQEPFFKKVPGRRRQKLYKTGDLARRLDSRRIEFLGRKDQQVKIRGYRIELEEIQNKIKNFNVKDAVVLDKEDDRGNRYLCAYIVLERSELFDIDRLRRGLALELPDYMIPPYFIQVNEIPLNAIGKVDREALLAKPDTPLGLNAAYTAPRDKEEETVAEICREVLKIDKLGITDNFFSLGATSFNIIRISNKLQEVFKREIPVITLFEYPTIAAFMEYMHRENRAAEEIPGREDEEWLASRQRGRDRAGKIKKKRKEEEDNDQS